MAAQTTTIADPEPNSSSGDSIMTIVVPAVAATVAVLVLIVVVLLVVRWRKDRRARRSFNPSHAVYPGLESKFVELSKAPLPDSISTASTISRSTMRTRFKVNTGSRWETSRDYIEVVDDVVLGEGAFGKVCLGHLREPLVASSTPEEETLVAVKEVKCEYIVCVCVCWQYLRSSWLALNHRNNRN